MGPGDTVSVMLPNTPEMVEAHYAVPALNAVLNTLNTRLKELREAGLVDHGPSGYLVTDAGKDLLRRLHDVQAFASRWAAGRARK